MTGTLMFLTILFLIILSLTVWGLIQIGIRIGGVRAARHIAEGLIAHLDLKPQSEGGGEEIGTDKILAELTVLRRRDIFFEGLGVREMRMQEFGYALADAAEMHGFAGGREWNAPKAGELSVIMKKEDLSHIAWLADYGLRVWIAPSNDYFRCGDRLTKDRAQELSDLLDEFDQKTCDLLNETKIERDMRFASWENRMKQMWENYPQ
jgi:hypothetical protein